MSSPGTAAPARWWSSTRHPSSWPSPDRSGPVCTAATWVLASPGIYDDFVSALAQYAKGHVEVGVPEEEEAHFGPVISVKWIADEQEAIHAANGVQFGLASSVWACDFGRAMRVSRALDFGCGWIDTHIPVVVEMPHGSFKHSGYGKDLSTYGFEDYPRIKHVMANINS